jgi:hypothetical protein
MPSMRFIENEDKFLEYSWSIYESYFNDKASFIEKYNCIDSPEKKNKFLRLTSYYYFFVIVGGYSSSKYDIEDISFVDQTNKFIAIVALIESIYDKNEYIDFYQWIRKNNKKNGLFPINDPKEASKLYATYKEEHGNTLNMVKFFQSLDDSVKLFIQRSIIVLDDSGKTGEFEEKEESIEALSKLLYQIRSDFIHRAELILEFDPSTVLSIRDRKPISCSIELKHVFKIFESGLLQHFGIIPDKKQI